MKKFYNGMNEYRWSFIHLMQGHYPLHKNINTALASVKRIANKEKNAITITRWKPRGKTIYIVKPNWMKLFSKKTLISYYKDKGYDISYIRHKNYVLK